MADVQQKFLKFQKPGDFDQRFDRVRRSVREMIQSLDMIRIESDDLSDVQAQLEKSQVSFMVDEMGLE